MTNEPEFLQSQPSSTALATLHPMPETQEQVNNFIALAVAEARNGYTDLLDLARRLKAASDAIEGIQKQLKDDILEEMAKYTDKGQFQYNGATFEPAQRKTLDLKECGDPVWEDLKKQLESREKFLKALQSPVFDEAAGGVEIYPATPKISTFYKIPKY